ncbi:MAG TPA: MTH938/NDUFAF3 family protein [Steroidobacteraceae bacterium]|nr:MTH938/NDUFAF3 family protein [Steroidobacteraceae bacterium]
MRFTQDSSSGTHLIRAYARGELRIDDDTYRETVIVSASGVLTEPEIRDMNDLIALDPSRILALDPELVLLGTGERQIFPAASFRARFLSAGIGLEVMDTGAACRTFNVLVAEQRRVVALLMVN